jgi:hypothetical protein
MMKILVPMAGAVAVTTVLSAYEAPSPAAAAAQLPCEVAITTPTNPTNPTPTPLSPPQNLRIIGGSGGGLDELEYDDSTSSGPYVDETEMAAAPVVQSSTHSYYTMLASRSDCARAYSLRDPAQLATRANGGFSVKNSVAPAVTYDPAVDAAKVVINAGSANLSNQVRLPIPAHAPQSLFVTWDARFGPEWINGGIQDQKTWQLASPADTIALEIRNRYAQGNNQNPGSVALIDGRLYPEGGYTVGPNITAHGTLAPQVGKFYIQPDRWTRWYAFLKPPSGGSVWWEYSLWAADAQTGVVQIFDKLQLRPNPNSTTGGWESFWLEFNTSSNTRAGTTFDLVAYVRNVVMLKGVSDPTSLLIRP